MRLIGDNDKTLKNSRNCFLMLTNSGTLWRPQRLLLCPKLVSKVGFSPTYDRSLPRFFSNHLDWMYVFSDYQCIRWPWTDTPAHLLMRIIFIFVNLFLYHRFLVKKSFVVVPRLPLWTIVLPGVDRLI